MSSRRHAATALLLSLLGLALPALAQAKPRIVGGTATAVASAPYQVALLSGTGSALQTQICGGTILDATHVATAAHCVTEEDGSLTPAAQLDVLAGATNLSQGDSATGHVQRVDVAEVARNPAYVAGAETNDSTLLTLATPLRFSADVQQIALGTDVLAAGTDLLISGWGCTTAYRATGSGCTRAAEYPDTLRATTIDVVADPTCAAQYGSDLVGAVMLCAGASGKDTCQGDSGGPAVTLGVPGDLSTYRLAGITSFGNGCADPGYAGVYAEVASPSVQSVLQARPAVTTTPLPTTAPSVAVSGSTVTCDPGEWTGGPTFAYRFTQGGADVQAASGDTTYTAGAAGTAGVACTVTGETPTASTSLASGQPVTTAVTVQRAAPAPVVTTPAPVTAPAPAPVAAAPAPAAPAPADTTAPTLRLATTRVTASRTGRLVLSFRPAGEAAYLTARVTATATVTKRRRTLALGTKRAVALDGTASTRLTVTLGASARRLLRQAGRLRLAVVATATDGAGNVARRTSTVTVLRHR